jgi:hypothetical protein
LTESDGGPPSRVPTKRRRARGTDITSKLACDDRAVLLRSRHPGSPFKSKLRFKAENAVLRHQLIVLRRRPRGRVRLTSLDRWFFIQLYRWFSAILKVLTIIRPETLVRWHSAGFRCYWRRKSRPRGGRPQIETELRVLIRRTSVEIRVGARLASTANCASSGFRSRSRASPSTWSKGGADQPGMADLLA